MLIGAVPVNSNVSLGAYPDYEPADWRTSQAGNLHTVTLDTASFSGGGNAGNYQTIEAYTGPIVGDKAYDWLVEIESASGDGTMTLRATSGNVEIWVADDLSFLPGDPRNADPYNTMISDEMCQYLADEFNNNIYPTDTQYFGYPYDRFGNETAFEFYGYPEEYWNWTATGNGQRIMIKVYNIVDNNYYDPGYPSYVAGFFSSGYNYYYYRNIIHIDSWRWWQRLGAAGTQWFDDRPDLIVNRPYVYESTATHEFQHNIHDDVQYYDDLFMNEGCSMYAEYLCGYGIDDGYLNAYFATPDNSLTQWGDQGDINILADYGAAALWTIYLSDHFGGSDFISYYMSQGIPSFGGINNALSHFGYLKDFESVFHDWKLANLIRSDFPGFGKYNYDSLNLNRPGIIPIRTYDVSGLVPAMTGSQFGSTVSYYGDDTGISLLSAYGSDYIRFTNWNKTGRLTFDGNDYAVYGWRFDSAWYSGSGVNLADFSLTGTAYVDPSNPTLTMNTKYSIEELWDYGFVQVSTDGGSTWTSLENAYTTYAHDSGVIDTALNNLPGLTGESPDFPSWTAMSFDLSAYSGQTVMIQFRYVTDWYTTEEGWYIKDAKVSGTLLALTGNPYPVADFEVTILQAIYLFGRWYYLPIDMPLNSANRATLLATAKSPSYVIMVVTPTMDVGSADYLFSALWR